MAVHSAFDILKLVKSIEVSTETIISIFIFLSKLEMQQFQSLFFRISWEGWIVRFQRPLHRWPCALCPFFVPIHITKWNEAFETVITMHNLPLLCNLINSWWTEEKPTNMYKECPTDGFPFILVLAINGSWITFLRHAVQILFECFVFFFFVIFG